MTLTILIRSISLAVLLFATSTTSQAQTQSDHTAAHLSGTLLDASGAAIAEVRITAEPENATAATHNYSAVSTSDGRYALSVPPGRYRTVFTRPAFTTREFTLDFSSGQSRNLDVRLDLERLSESVVVTAQPEPTPVQDTSASVTVITRQEIDQRLAVPLADLLLYTPGIAIGKNAAEGGLTSFFLDGGNYRIRGGNRGLCRH